MAIAAKHSDLGLEPPAIEPIAHHHLPRLPRLRTAARSGDRQGMRHPATPRPSSAATLQRTGTYAAPTSVRVPDRHHGVHRAPVERLAEPVVQAA